MKTLILTVPFAAALAFAAVVVIPFAGILYWLTKED